MCRWQDPRKTKSFKMSSAGSRGLAVVFSEDQYEDLELWYPKLRLKEAGFDVQVAGPEKDKTHKSKNGYPCTSNLSFKDIDPSKVKVLVIPGGDAPDRLRRYEECNKLVADIYKAGAVVAFICHAAWVPISAGILKGKKVTSFISVKDDCVNAGANWVSDRCVVDGTLVSAQTPDDLPGFMKAVLGLLQH